MDTVAYIVLPPGHGKSYLHLRIEGLLEADTLIPCRSTPLLSDLRTKAKQSGRWEDYDREWAREIKEVLPAKRCVLMVPSGDVGKLLGNKCLLKGVLTPPQWKENLASRGDSVVKYQWAWESALAEGAQLYSTNEELEQQILERTSKWTRE